MGMDGNEDKDIKGIVIIYLCKPRCIEEANSWNIDDLKLVKFGALHLIY